jgi:hypothetical protein
MIHDALIYGALMVVTASVITEHSNHLETSVKRLLDLVHIHSFEYFSPDLGLGI